MTVRGRLEGVFSWGKYNYGYKQLKYGNKYYRSRNVRFDDTCGGTEECTMEEYFEAAENRAKILG